MPGRNDGDDESIPYQQGKGEQSWEQRFQDIQQELNHMKETIKGRAPVFMDALVQQTESLFTTRVLHFPLPAKFRMPQIKPFDGTKDPVDHLNTYKNQMELHGYQNPVRYIEPLPSRLRARPWHGSTGSLQPQSHPSESSPSLSYPTSSKPERTRSRATTC